MASACTSSNSSRVVQMHKARSTLAWAMAARICCRLAASSGKLRWQWESTNMAMARRRRPRMRRRQTNSTESDGLGRALGREVAAEELLDLHLEQLRLVVRRETHADTLGAVGGGPRRRDPGDLAGHRIALRIVGQREQHVDVVAQLVVAGRRNEHAAVGKQRNVRGIQRSLLLDG